MADSVTGLHHASQDQDKLSSSDKLEKGNVAHLNRFSQKTVDANGLCASNGLCAI